MTDFGATTNLEKSSLEAHVDLCAMRYQQLDLRLKTLELKMDQVQMDIVNSSKSVKTVMITSAATVIGSLLAVVLAIIMN